MSSRSERYSRGFTLVELFMAMSLAIVVLLSIYYVYERMTQGTRIQTDVLEMHREARFALSHLKRDLMVVGSNVSPNSDVDAKVCPKPLKSLHAIQVTPAVNAVYHPEFNQNINPVNFLLFGNFDNPQPFHTDTIVGSTVTLMSEPQLPATNEEWKALFNSNHYLRIINKDGMDMLFPIASTDFAQRTVTLAQVPPQVDDTQKCGFHGFGGGLDVFVPHYLRYRIVFDQRAGAPTDAEGNPTRSLLVREHVGTDGATLVDQLVIAENIVDMSLYDLTFDLDPASEVLQLTTYTWLEDVVGPGGGWLDGSIKAKPEQLRFATLKLTMRGRNEDENMPFVQRADIHTPIDSYEADVGRRGVARTYSTANRLTFPALIARNL